MCMCGNCVVLHVQQAVLAKHLAEAGGERGGNAEGPAYDKDREICHYSNWEPESVQLHSVMLQNGSCLCGMVLLFVN